VPGEPPYHIGVLAFILFRGEFSDYVAVTVEHILTVTLLRHSTLREKEEQSEVYYGVGEETFDEISCPTWHGSKEVVPEILFWRQPLSKNHGDEHCEDAYVQSPHPGNVPRRVDTEECRKVNNKANKETDER
jgi:hypothetical protein